MTVNTALADVLDRQAAASESDALLAALVDHGVYVPVQGEGQVLFVQDEGGAPALPAYVSEECRIHRMPEASASVHCDALRLMDITGHTGVRTLLVFAENGWARVPVPLVQQTLRQRGRQGNGERLHLSWATDPHALALRAAFTERVREYPAVRNIWISHARWVDTGIEQLMVHVEVDEPLPSASTQSLMEGVLAQLSEATEPSLGVIALHTVEHAAFVAELEQMGLDTVRFDRETGRVTIVSREFDGPPAD